MYLEDSLLNLPEVLCTGSSSCLCARCILNIPVHLEFTLPQDHSAIPNTYIGRDSDVPLVNRRVQAAQKVLLKVQSLVNQAQQASEALQRYIAFHKSSITPIHKVPVEILETIFELVALSRSLSHSPSSRDHSHSGSIIGFNPETSEIPAMVLASVCRPWRSFMLQTPSLWSSISFVNPSHWVDNRGGYEYHRSSDLTPTLRTFDLCLARSKSRPLSLWFENPLSVTSGALYPSYQIVWNHINTLAMPRCRTLFLDPALLEDLLFMDGEFPRLQSLEIGYSEEEEEEQLQIGDNFFARLWKMFPCLSSLSTRHAGEILTLNPRHLPGSLLHLSYWPSGSNTSPLGSHANLVTLTLQFAYINEDQLITAHFSRLTTLNVRFGSHWKLSRVLHHIEAPNLSSLSFHGSDLRHHDNSGKGLPAMISHLTKSLRLLQLYLCPIAAADIKLILQEIPLEASLTLWHVFRQDPESQAFYQLILDYLEAHQQKDRGLITMGVTSETQLPERGLIRSQSLRDAGVPLTVLFGNPRLLALENAAYPMSC